MDNWMFAPSSTGASIGERAADNLPAHSSLRSPASPPDGHKSPHAQPRIRRRNRLITSCLECRRRKLKCDKTAPCTNCVRFKRDCLYLAATGDPHSQQKLADIKEKMGALEKTLEDEVAEQRTKAQLGGPSSTLAPHSVGAEHVQPDDEDDTEVEDDEVLEPTPLVALDNVYEDGADEESELLDLGVQLGRMRISERIGGWVRPKLADELTDTLLDVNGSDPPSATVQSADPRDQRRDPNQAKIQASPKSYIGPGPDYIAPASSFFFPGTNVDTFLTSYLPSKTAADQFVAQYFLAVHPIARAVHRQTFEAQYTLFWAQIATGVEPVPSQQAVVLALLFSAAVSLTEVQAMERFGTTKPSLIDSLRTGTEVALSKANFLRTTKLETMQAFVMYLIPLVRAEVSRAHSALVGTAIRLAECMGLHRDGTHYNMSAVEIHVRRMLWHQLCFLDMRTCEATGPRPQIRKDDYDTQYPLNVDDADLLSTSPPTEDHPYWTDMTMFRIRIEYYDLRRALWFDIVQIDRKKKSLTSTVVKVQKTRSRMYDQWLACIDESIPIQMAAKHILHLGVNGCFIQVLHRYLFSTSQKMPDRLRQILLEAGVTQLENCIAFETKPELAPWAWYKGAMNQYHAALLLLVEIYIYPMRKEAGRIWKCLDYIFETPAHLSPKQKAELVLTDLRDRLEIYHQMRKIRSTTHMEARVAELSSWPHNRNKGSPSFTEPPDPARLAASVTQPYAVTNMGLPAGFSPPMIPPTDSSGSRQGSAPPQNMDQMMDDIDWAEWDKYFPLEQNTGDLNLTDFDLADFTGMSAQGAAPQMGTASHLPPTQVTLPTAQDLEDVAFAPATYFTHPGYHDTNR